MRRTVTRITTADTKKTHEFPAAEGEPVPKLWEATLTLKPVGAGGAVSNYQCDTISTAIFLELETLERAGLKVRGRGEKEPETEPTETIEELLIRLLEHLGVYPTE